MTFYFYNAYGLNIRSSLAFPELIPKKSNSDVVIHSYGYESLCKKMPNNNNGFNKVLFTYNDILYFFDNEPLFRVRHGNEIIFNPNVNINMNLFRYLILCQGMGTLLMQRGNLVVHASSIKIGNKAIAFLGCCGDGKSTIAAAMNKKKCSIVTDDVLAINFDNQNEPLVFPSFPRVKLCEDVFKCIINESDTQISPEIEKYSYNVDKNFSLNPLPLKMIYVLKKHSKNGITPLKSQNALIELIKNSYAINLFDDNKRSQNLIQCAEIVKTVPVKCLKRTQSLNNLGDLTQMIEKDIINI